MRITIPVAVGELIDKLTILRIKSERIKDGGKLNNVRRELAALEQLRAEQGIDSPELRSKIEELTAINAELWEIEDRIRDCERRRQFGAEFIELARAVYRTNDLRAAVKREINELLGSEIVEEKAYPEYRCEPTETPARRIDSARSSGGRRGRS